MVLPRWIAHRGGGTLAPENTLAGIRLAAQHGFAAVEFDVMLSGSGTPVLIHDETLERTTNGRGRVCDTLDADLFLLDAGQGECIPRLAQAARLCQRLHLLANIEIKPSAGQDGPTAATVARHVETLWRGGRVPPLISSFSMEALEIVRDLLPGVPRGVLFDELPANWSDEMRRCGASTLHCAAAKLSKDALDEVRAAGVPLLCYTVNAAGLAGTLFAKGVSALFTDQLDLLSHETSAYKGLQLKE